MNSIANINLFIFVVSIGYTLQIKLESIEEELKRFDQELGIILHRQQLQLWNWEVNGFNENLKDVYYDFKFLNLQQFYDYYKNWANDRYYKVLHCRSSIKNKDPKVLKTCSYLKDVLKRFDASWDESFLNEYGNRLEELKRRYRQLPGIIYNNCSYFGEESIDRLLKKIDDSYERKLIWNQWNQMVDEQMSEPFDSMLDLLGNSQYGGGSRKFGCCYQALLPNHYFHYHNNSMLNSFIKHWPKTYKMGIK
ncbi:hypothetical protein RDWZM_002971 [Blomia tropicalis]|uniref:Uncharacterized protein n=1 Tax=Blomia tropicalis TaxID=40697 RepID=A0A9Q0RSM6_BLOTA|nr:hypothetical protein RDWZM_002971 [Blomia tropicalis]